MTYRLCDAGLTLRAEINKRWPNRDKKSDGWIGDAAHASRSSDHNPWVRKAGVGIVRAIDIDVDGVDMAYLMEHLRRLGESGDRRLSLNGYLIFNERITAPGFRSWRAYTGSNPHTAHGHVSFSTDPVGFDLTTPWGLLVPGVDPAPRPTPSPPAAKEESMALVPQEQWDQVYRQEMVPIEFADHHGATKDNQFGQVLSIRKELVSLRGDVRALTIAVAALTAKVDGA